MAPPVLRLAVGGRFDVRFAVLSHEELRRDVFDVAVMGRLASRMDPRRASAHTELAQPWIFAATEITGYSVGRDPGTVIPAGSVSGPRWRQRAARQYDTIARLLSWPSGARAADRVRESRHLMLARATPASARSPCGMHMGASALGCSDSSSSKRSLGVVGGRNRVRSRRT